MSSYFARPSRHLLHISLISALLFATWAGSVSALAISKLTVDPVAPVEQQSIRVTVDFDTPICALNQATAADLATPVTSVLQSRVDGTLISIALSTSTLPSNCTLTRTAIVTLPQLSAGNYTLRVATSTFSLTSTIYANNSIGSVGSSNFSVSPALPTPMKVFLSGGPMGTALYPVDAGGYQYFPTYATDLNQWQPVFYAWPWKASQNHPSLKPIYALISMFTTLAARNFYTLDAKERDAMVASGAFADAYPPNSGVVFAAVSAVGGICPGGLVPIYRAYEPKVIIHRFVPQSAYRLLLGNGWTGDGIVFCVAGEVPGGSSWAPN